MSHTPAFEWLCQQLEAATPLDELETRGTVRLVLKDAGREPGSASPEDIAMLLRRVLPEALRLRGVDESDDLCQRLLQELPGLALGATA